MHRVDASGYKEVGGKRMFVNKNPPTEVGTIGSAEEFNAGKLIEMFDEINNNLDDIGQKERDKCCEISEIVKGDFARMVANIGLGEK